MTVSIHAPVRGATESAFAGVRKTVFQSTPPCGGRRKDSVRTDVHPLFQSTPPCGGRPVVDFTLLIHIGHVSIHAPVRGATDGPTV